MNNLHTQKENQQLLNDLLDRFELSKKEKEEFLQIATPIIKHEEFQKRMNAEEFPHHAKVSLGEHIISDAILTYKLTKKKKWKKEEQKRAIRIALFHDLYELPWQNNDHKKKFVNKHGFTHPIEAAINAATWYPEIFKEEVEREIILDGIIHHMFPFPVRALNDKDVELHNQEKFEKLPADIKKNIIDSSKRKKIKSIAFSRSKYQEGKIVSKADKKIAWGKELKSFHGLLACITGRNPKLEEKDK